MKVLGIGCGRKASNTEILVKEALMGAEEAGAEVEFIRLNELDLKPCTGCNACVVDLFEKAGSGKCVIKDDLGLIDGKIMECDGLIVGSPIYEKSPTGYLKILNDRMGPSHDMAFRMIAKKIREERHITAGEGPDERSFKPRVASLFAVGGSDWTEFALPLLQLFVMPMQIKVVDQHLFNWIALPGVACLREDMLARARKSGRHVAESLGKPVGEAAYIGDEGLCPVCHSRLLELCGSPEQATCATCGAKGRLRIDAGKLSFEVDEAARARSHMTLSGKFAHADDLKNRSLKPLPDMGEIPGKLGKYRSYLAG